MFDPDNNPRWRFLLSGALEERAKAELLLCPLRGPSHPELVVGRDFEVEEAAPPAAPWTVWFVFPDRDRYWRAVDALQLAGMDPLVMDDFVSVGARRKRLGLPDARGG